MGNIAIKTVLVQLSHHEAHTNPLHLKLGLSAPNPGKCEGHVPWGFVALAVIGISVAYALRAPYNVCLRVHRSGSKSNEGHEMGTSTTVSGD